MQPGYRMIIGAVALLALAWSARAQGSAFDGVYRGEPTSGNGCSVFSPTLRVDKGVATLRYNPSTTFEGGVGGDGSLDVPFGQARLNGRFSEGRFQGAVASRGCQYPLSLSKKLQ